MKNKNLLTAILLLFIINVMAEDTIYVSWRCSNQQFITIDTSKYYQFDVELSCSHTETYINVIQLYTVFGTNIVANDKLSYTKLPLLQGDIGGIDFYSTYYGDNTSNIFTFIAEANIVCPFDPSFCMNEIPQNPAWSGLYRFQIKIPDIDSINPGIHFYEEIMNLGQYFVNQNYATINYQNIFMNVIAAFCQVTLTFI